MFHNKIAKNQRFTGRKSISTAQEKAMIAEYRAGVPVADLAKKYICSQATVTRTMKRYGEPLRSKAVY
jgi:Mor family transcriptional regulator